MTSRFSTGLIALMAFAGLTAPSPAQEIKNKQNVDPAAIHFEKPDDPYVPVNPSERKTTRGGRWERNGYVSVQVNVDAEGNNIVGDAANEPSIAVDPENPYRMAIGWRQFDTVESSFRQAGYGYTTDGGETWTFPGVLEPGVYRTDPVLGAGPDGDFYYYSLHFGGGGADDLTCQLFKSIDGGATWNEGIEAYGGDKAWMVIDQTDGNGRNNLYMAWVEMAGDKFICSYNGGQTFRPPSPVPSDVRWGTLAVGPDSEVYVVGQSLGVSKSSTMQDEFQVARWDSTSTVNLNGSVSAWDDINPGGLSGQPWIAVDHSGGVSRGNVYVLSSVDPTGPDPLDVMFSRSEDGGLTWSDPVRINDDPQNNGAWQWFGTMSVAPNGRIDAVWNDTRNDPGGYMSEVYYSYSVDAGQTWSANEVATPAFDPHVGWPQDNKLGDYYHMTSDSTGANLAFAATFNGEQDVYYLRLGEPLTLDGMIKLDRYHYSCEDVAIITVEDGGPNLDDEFVESVEVSIVSDTEPSGENVVLVETGADTGRFSGQISLSKNDAAGILQVADSDGINVVYEDADNGAGAPATVTDYGILDCEIPTIHDLCMTVIWPYQPYITFATNESCYATVRYGSACEAPTQSDSSSGREIRHLITLTEAEEDGTYFLTIDLEDQAGNQVVYDDDGSCYEFDTHAYWREPEKLLPDDGVYDSEFGVSVAIDGDVAIAGANLHDIDVMNAAGAAYVFRRSSNGWGRETLLVAADAAGGDKFGVSVSLSDDVALIGAYLNNDIADNAGVAYVFRYDGAAWTQEAKLLPDDGAAEDQFGEAVSVSGDVAVIGSPLDDDNGDNSGSAYVFRYNHATEQWDQEAKLLAGDGALDDQFGKAVSVSGDVVVVGAQRDDDCGNNSGSAYVYVYDPVATGWEQTAKLLPGNDTGHARFGCAVSAFGDRILIGAYQEDFYGGYSGAAYVFSRYDAMREWELETKLTPASGAAGDRFGCSVSLTGNLASIGAYGDSYSGQKAGSAYLFRRNGSVWTQEAELLPADGEAGDRYGISISVSDDAAMVGSYWDDNDYHVTGSAYVYSLCLGDLNGDDSVNLNDLADLLGRYGSCLGEPAFSRNADFDGSGCVDLPDLALILGRYGATCE